MKSIYIAGPITGIQAYKGRFTEAEERLTRMGWAVLNPARLPIGLEPDRYMPICMALLQAADAICLLPGWDKSRGAKLERAFADYQGKEIFEGVGDVPSLIWEAATPSGAGAPPSPKGQAFGGVDAAPRCDSDGCPIEP